MKRFFYILPELINCLQNLGRVHIDTESFEEAAKLRDEARDLESQLSTGGDQTDVN